MNLFFDRPFPQCLSSTCPRSFAVLELQQITWLAFQSTAQLVQDVGAVHSRAIVVQPEQRGIANTRFLPQAIDGPSLLFENFRKPRRNHGRNVAGSQYICQAIYTYIVYFTYQCCRSTLATSLKGDSDIEVAVTGSEVGRHAN
jgi:hypothetical protein